jgi:hypothetical protein
MRTLWDPFEMGMGSVRDRYEIRLSVLCDSYAIHKILIWELHQGFMSFTRALWEPYDSPMRSVRDRHENPKG